MASTLTYIKVTNIVLRELNEVVLTDSSFTNAVGIHQYVKDCVNKSLFDINNDEYKWPFLAVSGVIDPTIGNTYIETTAGNRWYDLSNANGLVSDYPGFVDWRSFTVTTNGVAGEAAPYVYERLNPKKFEEFKKSFEQWESRNDLDGHDGGQPRRVVRSPDGKKFGLSPIPDKVYRIYFFAWEKMSAVSAYNDMFVLDDQHVYSVLIPRVRYYSWMHKENSIQSQLADTEYKHGLRRMREQLIDSDAERKFIDTRSRFV